MTLFLFILALGVASWAGLVDMKACYEANKEEIDDTYRLADCWETIQQHARAVGEDCLVFSFRERGRLYGGAWLSAEKSEYAVGAGLARMELGLSVVANLMGMNDLDPQYIEWLSTLHVNRSMITTLFRNEEPLTLLFSMDVESLLPVKAGVFKVKGDEHGCLYLMDARQLQIERGFGECQKASLVRYGTALVKMVARNYLGMLLTGQNLGDASDRKLLLTELQELLTLSHDVWTFPELELVRLLTGVRFPEEKGKLDCECRLSPEQWQSLPQALRTSVKDCLTAMGFPVPAFAMDKNEQR